jgi:hypothetical protein
MRRDYRPAPPPLEANERLVTVLVTAGWAIALSTLLVLRAQLPASERWWIWTCATGFAMGLFGLWYVPHLKRKRARTAQRQAEAAARAAETGGNRGAPGPAKTAKGPGDGAPS